MMTLGEDKLKYKLQPNVHSLLIDCTYNVEVLPLFDVSFSCCSNVPAVSLPLYIHGSELSNWISKPPPTFKPKMFDLMQILIPISPSITGELNIAAP